MSNKIIGELLNDLSMDDLTELLLELEGKAKEKKKAATKTKTKEVILEYEGKVTFVCKTCSKEFDRTFISNIPNQHIHKEAPTCIYCADMLQEKSKDELITMILSDRKEWYRIC